MDLSFQRRIAASIMKCGENRVRFDPERLDEIEEAITRAEVKRLIEDGAIYAEQPKGQTRSRVKEKRGIGRRKGAKYSVLSRKERWMMKVRAQRKYLRRLRDSGILDPSSYRYAYLQVKAGRFKSVSDLKRFLKENNFLPESGVSRRES